MDLKRNYLIKENIVLLAGIGGRKNWNKHITTEVMNCETPPSRAVHNTQYKYILHVGIFVVDQNDHSYVTIKYLLELTLILVNLICISHMTPTSDNVLWYISYSTCIYCFMLCCHLLQMCAPFVKLFYKHIFFSLDCLCSLNNSVYW